MLLGDPGVLISSGWGMGLQFHFWQINQIMYTELMLALCIYTDFIWAVVDRQYLSSTQAWQCKVNLSKKKPTLWTHLHQQLAFACGQWLVLWICAGVDLTRCFKAVLLYYQILPLSVVFGNLFVFWRNSVGIGEANILIHFSFSKHLFSKASAQHWACG